MPTQIILQARTGSTRLPNKMLMPFHEGKGILQILLERIRSAFPEGFDRITVATTTSPGDDRIAELCAGTGFRCFRGSESDVLERFIGAAEEAGADKIIRVCADNVFLDTAALRSLYDRIERENADYASFRTSAGVPSIKTHYGFWAEGVTLNALRRVRKATDEAIYHEHVTNYIYTHPEDFTIDLRPISDTIEGIENYPDLRLTIDTREDFDISREIYATLSECGNGIKTTDILSYLDGRADLFARMRTVINQNTK